MMGIMDRAWFACFISGHRGRIHAEAGHTVVGSAAARDEAEPFPGLVGLQPSPSDRRLRQTEAAG